jgi:hypothetical protein
MGEEVCSRFSDLAHLPDFSPRLALESSRQLSLHFCFALLSRPRLPCVIYIPTRTVQSTGNIS